MLLNLKTLCKQLALIQWNDVYVSIINNFSRWRRKVLKPFCLIILHMIAHNYHVEFVTIIPESFQVYYHLFSHRSARLVDSTQSCFLWNYYKGHVWISDQSILKFWPKRWVVEYLWYSKHQYDHSTSNDCLWWLPGPWLIFQVLVWYSRPISIRCHQLGLVTNHRLEFCRVRFHSIITKPLKGDFAVIE